MLLVFLHYFTFLSIEEIAEVEESDRQAQGRPQAQAMLAREATKLVHGEEGLAAALRITEALFNGEPDQLSEKDFEHLQKYSRPTNALQAFYHLP